MIWPKIDCEKNRFSCCTFLYIILGDKVIQLICRLIESEKWIKVTLMTKNKMRRDEDKDEVTATCMNQEKERTEKC